MPLARRRRRDFREGNHRSLAVPGLLTWSEIWAKPAEACQVRLSRFQVRLRPISTGKIGISSDAPRRALQRDSMMTGEEIQRRDGRKPRRNDEPPRDAGHTGSAGPHRPARRRYRRRVQLRPDPGDQLAEHPDAFLTGELGARRPGSCPAGSRGFPQRSADPGWMDRSVPRRLTLGDPASTQPRIFWPGRRRVQIRA